MGGPSSHKDGNCNNHICTNLSILRGQEMCTSVRWGEGGGVDVIVPYTLTPLLGAQLSSNGTIGNS